MLTRQCWNWGPKERPKFEEIVRVLKRILTPSPGEEYLDLENIRFLDETSSIRSDEDDDFNSATTYHPFIR